MILPSCGIHWETSWVVYGGIIGGILGAFLFCKWKKFDHWKYFDLHFQVLWHQGIWSYRLLLCRAAVMAEETHSAFHVVFHNSMFAPNDVRLIPG